MGSRRSNLLFRWFLGLSMDDPVWDVTVFTKDRKRLRGAKWRWAYFNAVLDQALTHDLLRHCRRYPGRGVGFSQELRAQGGGICPMTFGNPTIDFHSERRVDGTH